MKAAVYEGFKKMGVHQVPDARIVDPEDMIVKVTATTICGSDLHFYHGFVPSLERGSIIGHEAVGVVIETGPAVSRVKKGDQVVIPFNIACGRCSYCIKGLESLCDTSNKEAQTGSFFGCSRLFGDYSGCQAELVRVPYANFTSFVVPRDNELEDHQLLLLSDCLPTAYWGAYSSGIQTGDTVIVLGCGPIGLLTQKCAWLRGAKRVIAVDVVPERLEYAKRVNQAEVYNLVAEKELTGQLYETTGGGAEVVIDCVGGDGLMTLGEMGKTLLRRQGGGMSAFVMGSQVVAKGGTIQLLGAYGLRYDQFPLGDLFARGITLKMGYAPVIHLMDPLYELLKTRSWGTDIYSHTFTLDEAPTAYRMFDKKEDGCLKVLIRP